MHQNKTKPHVKYLSLMIEDLTEMHLMDVSEHETACSSSNKSMFSLLTCIIGVLSASLIVMFAFIPKTKPSPNVVFVYSGWSRLLVSS